MKLLQDGALLSRCLQEHNCIPIESDSYKKMYEHFPVGRTRALETHHHEIRKTYPQRYPDNEDSIGIEVVGMYLGAQQDDKGSWEEPTAQQQHATHWLVPALLDALHLQILDVYRHPQVSQKKDNEAYGVQW